MFLVTLTAVLNFARFCDVLFHVDFLDLGPVGRAARRDLQAPLPGQHLDGLVARDRFELRVALVSNADRVIIACIRSVNLAEQQNDHNYEAHDCQLPPGKTGPTDHANHNAELEAAKRSTPRCLMVMMMLLMVVALLVFSRALLIRYRHVGDVLQGVVRETILYVAIHFDHD